MLPWAIVLGAVGRQHMELLSYQETSHHGHAVARFHPGEKRNAEPSQPYWFQSHPFHYYDHPPIAAYRLNKLLYESRHKPALRQRMFRDLYAVCMEYGLGMTETSAMRAVFEFRHLDGDRPALDAEPVVGVGAHPVGALMAVHGLQQEKRAMRKPAAVSHDVALALTH
jgi:hypothetical protein